MITLLPISCENFSSEHRPLPVLQDLQDAGVILAFLSSPDAAQLSPAERLEIIDMVTHLPFFLPPTLPLDWAQQPILGSIFRRVFVRPVSVHERLSLPNNQIPSWSVWRTEDNGRIGLGDNVTLWLNHTMRIHFIGTIQEAVQSAASHTLFRVHHIRGKKDVFLKVPKFLSRSMLGSGEMAEGMLHNRRLARKEAAVRQLLLGVQENSQAGYLSRNDVRRLLGLRPQSSFFNEE